MTVRIFSFLCLAMSLIGIVPEFLNPGIRGEKGAWSLFTTVMIMMGIGFGLVARALSKMGARGEK